MRWIYIPIILIIVVMLGLWLCFENLKAEDMPMQTVVKTDAVSKDGIEFQLQLYTLQTIQSLIPSISNIRNPNAIYEKYVFCTVRNLSKQYAIHVKFRIVGKKPNENLRSPEIILPWLSAANIPDNQQYLLIPLGNLYTVDSFEKVKLDVEILKLQRK